VVGLVIPCVNPLFYLHAGSLRLARGLKPGRRGRKIYRMLGVGGRRDCQSSETIHEAMIDAMIRLHAAINPFIPTLPAP
jgi:hypothetical protein